MLVGLPDDIELYVSKDMYESHYSKLSVKELKNNFYKNYDNKTIFKFGCLGIIFTKEELNEIGYK